MNIGSTRRALLALLAGCLLLSGCSLVRPGRLIYAPRVSAEDVVWHADSLAEEVISAAVIISQVARLRDVYGGYMLRPCEDGHGPRYRATAEMSFAVPAAAKPMVYLHQLANTMVEDGWHRLPAPGMKPSRVVIRLYGVFAVMQTALDRDWATIHLYGDCLINADTDKASWVDITDLLVPQ